jgi:hypothetical protein
VDVRHHVPTRDAPRPQSRVDGPAAQLADVIGPWTLGPVMIRRFAAIHAHVRRVEGHSDRDAGRSWLWQPGDLFQKRILSTMPVIGHIAIRAVHSIVMKVMGAAAT